jgi:hypothetical protein
MIELGKKYTTRDGREVRIYAVDGGGRFPVHGSVKNNSCTAWTPNEWTETGSHLGDPEFRISDLDLIVVRLRIQREVWVNVFRHDDGAEFFEACESKANADLIASDARIACVKVVIDCEEGEGL